MNIDLENCIRALADGRDVKSNDKLTEALLELGLEYKVKAGLIQLLEPIELLNPDVIMRHISSEPRLEIHWTINSTNSYLMGMKTGLDSVIVCLAEQQLAGKGRRGKTWVSPFGKNIYLSVGKSFTRRISDLGGLSLVAGTQVVKTLHACGLLDAGLKWPNDIILGKGKLAGILVELGVPAGDRVFAVVGVGVNFSLQEKDSREIGQPWSAVGQYLSVSRNEIAGKLTENLLQAMQLFEIEGFSAFHQEWSRYDLYSGLNVVVHRGAERIDGRDVGVDEDGNLLLETTNGIQVFNAGEVSLRTRD